MKEEWVCVPMGYIHVLYFDRHLSSAVPDVLSGCIWEKREREAIYGPLMKHMSLGHQEIISSFPSRLWISEELYS